MSRVADAGLSRLAFAALVVGLAVLIGVVVWAGWTYPGYDHTRQFMSELGATGAVTGRTVSIWGFIPNGVLMTVFGVLAAWILRRSALAVTACLMLAAFGVGMTGGGVYPCDFECSRSDPSPASFWHDVFGGVGYLSAILGVGLASLWARKNDAPGLARLGLVALIVSVVGFYGIIAEVERAGVFQRAMELAIAVFMLALGWMLMRGLRSGRS